MTRVWIASFERPGAFWQGRCIGNCSAPTWSSASWPNIGAASWISAQGTRSFDTTEGLERVERALAPYPNVFLILPSPDKDESISVLNERLEAEGVRFNFDFSAHFVNHPANYRLAKHVIYTGDNTPAQTVEEIIGHRRILHQSDAVLLP